MVLRKCGEGCTLSETLIGIGEGVEVRGEMGVNLNSTVKGRTGIHQTYKVRRKVGQEVRM